MAYKVAKYRLNADGTIPDFVYCGHNPMSMHGVYVVIDINTPAPRDNVMIGIIDTDFSGMVGLYEVIDTKDDLEKYLTSVSKDWTDPDPDDPEKTVAFDNAAHAKKVWDALDACNATL